VMVVCAIMVFFTWAVSNVVFLTVTKMTMGTRQQIAQDSASYAINQIADQLVGAGADDFEHIISGSGSTQILFRRYKENYDGYNPSSDDMNDDILCYGFVPPSGGDPYDNSYQPGYIRGGRSSGEEKKCTNWHRITDVYTDIRSFKILYCRPDDGDLGTFDCSTASIDNSDLNDYLDGNPARLDDTAACVWMVKLYVEYSRVYNKKSEQMDSAYYENSKSNYFTAVNLRNAYIMAKSMNKNKNKWIDCCESEYGMKNARWCPEPQSSGSTAGE